MVLVSYLDCLEQLLDLEPFLPVLADLVLPDHFLRLLLAPLIGIGQQLKVPSNDFPIVVVELPVIDGVSFYIADYLYIAGYFLLDFLVPADALLLEGTIFEHQVSVPFFPEVELVLVVSASLVLGGQVVDGLLILDEGRGGGAVLLRVALIEYGVNEGRVQSARANANQVSKPNILDADAQLCAAEDIQPHALGDGGLGDEGAGQLGEFAVNGDLVALHLLQAGGKVEVVVLQHLLGGDGPQVAAHELEDVDGSLVLCVVVAVWHLEDLFEGQLCPLSPFFLAPALRSQVIRQILGIKINLRREMLGHRSGLEDLGVVPSEGTTLKATHCIHQSHLLFYWLFLYLSVFDFAAQLLCRVAALEELPIASPILPIILLLREGVIVVADYILVKPDPFAGLPFRHLLQLQLLLDDSAAGLAEKRPIDLQVVLDAPYLVQVGFPQALALGGQDF